MRRQGCVGCGLSYVDCGRGFDFGGRSYGDGWSCADAECDCGTGADCAQYDCEDEVDEVHYGSVADEVHCGSEAGEVHYVSVVGGVHCGSVVGVVHCGSVVGVVHCGSVTGEVHYGSAADCAAGPSDCVARVGADCG